MRTIVREIIRILTGTLYEYIMKRDSNSQLS